MWNYIISLFVFLFFFCGFFWLFLWECMLPWNQRFHVLYTELISAHRAVPPNLWTRLTEFDYITHPNTQTQWNTDMCTDTHATHSYSVKISESSPWFCGEKSKKRSITWLPVFMRGWTALTGWRVQGKGKENRGLGWEAGPGSCCLWPLLRGKGPWCCPSPIPRPRVCP